MGQSLLIIEASRSHSDKPRSVELLWTSDRPEQRPRPDKTQNWQETSMPPAAFEPTVPATERLQTHAFDGAATEIGLCTYIT
jgi:hypothetical protein